MRRNPHFLSVVNQCVLEFYVLINVFKEDNISSPPIPEIVPLRTEPSK